MIFYLSGTGNSQHVASELSKRTGENLTAIYDIWNGETFHYELTDDEVVGFVFPIYSWGPPSPILQFIRDLTLNHPNPYIFVTCTCGDDIGRTSDILHATFKKKRWEAACIYSVIMPENYVCLPGFDVDTPQNEQKKLQALPTQLEKIAQTIHERKRGIEHVIPGKFPFLKSYIIRPLFNKFLVTDRFFHTTPSCNGCSKCSRECPTKNIEIKDKRPVWKGKCIGCLRCYHTCPMHSIHFGKMTEKKGQYLFQPIKKQNKFAT